MTPTPSRERMRKEKLTKKAFKRVPYGCTFVWHDRTVPASAYLTIHTPRGYWLSRTFSGPLKIFSIHDGGADPTDWLVNSCPTSLVIEP